MLRTDDLQYDLPEASIATAPAEPRDTARLMVLGPGGVIAAHQRMRDLPGALRPGDLLVFNATRVLRARFEGKREDTGGRAEGLFLSEERDSAGTRWVCLVRMKRVKPGVVIAVEREGAVVLRLVAIEPRPDELGAWLVEPRWSDGTRVSEPASDVLEKAGLTPLPPYILRAREHLGIATDETRDRSMYQTVYAKEAAAGSVAAPTAGLHFTPEVLAGLKARGVETAEVTLAVGTGTFRTVEAEHVEEHPMHAEWCSMDRAVIERVLAVKREGRRVIAVGTTSARTLESYARVIEGGGDWPESLSTRILITPGYAWTWVDGMVTNFHLPRSTLMAMVAARIHATGEAHGPVDGVARLKAAYSEAIRLGYRFYSFGDGMLVV